MKTFLRNKIRGYAERFSLQLNEKASRFSKIQQRFLLIIFSLLVSVICFSIVVQAISGRETDPVFTKKISMPKHIGKSSDLPKAFISDSDYMRVEAVTRRIDSLPVHDKEKYSPLLDSIRLFEKLYNNQSKK
ncbi:MAG TPA: hypothetical protein VMT76_01660 [Puia sp.]|nr:hypothetical protein [Puia sp.]